MLIRVIRTLYPHWGAYSGINQFVRYLDQGKYSIDIRVVSDGDDDFPMQNQAIRNCLRFLVQINGMRWYKLSDLTLEMRLLWECRRQNIDIIHYLDGEHSAQFLPQLLHRMGKPRPRIIATYHQHPEMLKTLVRKQVIAKLDCVTLVSPEQVPFFEELLPGNKIRMILHGVDTTYFRPVTRPKDNGIFRCITVGHYQRDYNVVREVAQQLNQHQNIEFHIVTSRITGVEDLPNVRIYRDIDDGRLLSLYQQADILFLPLLQSTANNALLEGMACGLPVVSTDLLSVRSYVPSKDAILIKDNEPRQFVDAILRLVHGRYERQAMAISARKRAEELDWRNVVMQYEDLYSMVSIA